MNAVISRSTLTELECNDWPALLERHKLIEGVGGASDPYKVIRVHDELWDRDRALAQQALPGLGTTSQAAESPGESIATPARFLRDLRARFALTSRVQVHGAELTLPFALRHIATEINASRSLLDLEEGWDGEGTVSYSYKTWIRAVRFLASNADRLWEEMGYLTLAPNIGPGPDGSIDLHWTLPRRELLINFPQDYSRDAGFYGDNGKRGEPIEGKLNTAESRMWVLMWLANQ